MTVSPNPAVLSNKFADLPAEIVSSFENLIGVLANQAQLPDTADEFERFENDVLEHLFELGRTIIKTGIEQRDDPDLNRVEKDGQVYYRQPETKKTIMTALGPVSFDRARYRTGKNGSSWFPVDGGLGLVGNDLTRTAGYRALLMVTDLPPSIAAKKLADIGALTPSASTLQRLPQVMQGHYEDLSEEVLAGIREDEEIPDGTASLAVSLDGVSMTVLRAGAGEADWKEASCGTVAYYDEEGTRLKTLYFGQMPEPGKVTLKGSLFDEVATIRERCPDLPLVAVADGAKDNWTFLESLSPDVSVMDSGMPPSTSM